MSDVGRNWRDTTSTEQLDQHSIDALATVASHEGDNALYGGSSTIAFVKHVAQGVEEPAMHQGFSKQEGLQDHPEVVREKDESAAVYPRRRNADDYLQCYWEFIHPIFPVLHKPSLLAKYEELWRPENDACFFSDTSEVDNALFSSTLNLIFALGCQLSTLVPSRKKASMADEFYQRSRKLFVFEILDSTSLRLVQWLLLQGVYLQSSRYATRCWNVVGLAIRVAQSLGLHLNIERKGETQLMREMRRRVWYSCLALDR